MKLSNRFKEAFKTGLAMATAYGIALAMDWGNPEWAGFAVAFVSLATSGQSLNKAAYRMLGTFVAVTVALTLIALFAQDRWPFIFFLSLYIAVCTYFMAGSKRSYFWFVSGFVCVIIAFESGPNSVDAFSTAMLRVQETALGILVYGFITTIIWPNNSRADFEQSVQQLATVQGDVFRSYRRSVVGESMEPAAAELFARQTQLQQRMVPLLDAAETDSYEVWERRRHWRRYRDLVLELSETMERWRESFADVQALDLNRLVPDLDSFHAELDQRLGQIGRMLAGQPFERAPARLKLAADREAVSELSHFENAALTITQECLNHIEEVTHALFDTVASLHDFGTDHLQTSCAPRAAKVPVLNPDHLVSGLKAMINLWLAALLYLFVDGIPGGVGLVILANSLGMTVAAAPQLSVWSLPVPAATGVLIGGIAYIFVMPQLTSFAGLGVLIFAVTFLVCFVFFDPRQALGRTFGLAMFITIIGVQNQQTYSFLSFADTALMLPIIFVILAIVAHVPFSPQPEKAYLRLLRRYFRSCEYLMSTMSWGLTHTPTRLQRWLRSFHLDEISRLPPMLGSWGRLVAADPRYSSSKEQIEALVVGIESLTLHMHQLMDARPHPQSTCLVQELLGDIRAWRLAVQQLYAQLSVDPGAAEQEDLQLKLEQRLHDLERKITLVIDRTGDGGLTENEQVNFYRVLGAYRGLSGSLLQFIVKTGAIAWPKWREARF